MHKFIFIRVFIGWVLLIFAASGLHAQEEQSLKRLFIEAESYYLFEEYKEALPNYLRILKYEPDNYNVIYKVGVCYLNDKFKKARSVDYLEKAIAGAVRGSKPSNFKEKNAPVDAYFYLGDAYRANNRLKDAIKQYNIFLNVLEEKVHDRELVKARIRETEFAIRALKNPGYYSRYISGKTINSRYSEGKPVVSGDGSTLAFTRDLPLYKAVFVSYKTKEGWSEPQNLVPLLGIDDFHATGLSFDGTELFIYKSDKYDGNIYSCKRVNGKWQTPRKLNAHINTKYWESHASVSEDGNTLVFTSNRREGGFGGLDIYISHKKSNGDWGPAENLGPTVNSEYNEESPFFVNKEKYIYFSSQGHENMGGYDVFYAKLKSGTEYRAPVNLGYPINTSGDEIFFQPLNKGNLAYFTAYAESGYGLDDIYLYEFFNDAHPRMFTLEGKLDFDKKIPDALIRGIALKLINRESEAVEAIKYLNGTTGEFDLGFKHGLYTLEISGTGIETAKYNIDAPISRNDVNLELNKTLKTNYQPEKKAVVKEMKKTSPPILDIKYDSVVISENNLTEVHIQANKKAMLTIEHFHENASVKQDEVQVRRTVFTYTLELQQGTNRIYFTSKDKQDRIVKETIVIRYEPVNTESIAVAAEVEEEPAEILWADRKFADASAELKQLLSEINRRFYNSPFELYEKLYRKADEYYLRNEIDRIYAAYYARKTVAHYVNDFIYIQSGNISLTAASIDKSAMIDTREVFDYLVQSTGITYNETDFLTVMAYMLVNNEEERVDDLYYMLQANADGYLKNEIESIEPTSADIEKPSRLLYNIADSAAKGNFEINELYGLLHELSADIALEKLYYDLLFCADGSFYDYLLKFDFDRHPVEDSRDFILYLLDELNNRPFTSEEVIRILVKARNYKLDASFVKQTLAENSTEVLGEYILNIDDEEVQTLGYNGLINKTVKNDYGYMYRTDDVIDMMLHVIDIDDVYEFIEQYLDMAGTSHKSYVLTKNFMHFTEPKQFIDFLISEEDNNDYMISDVVDVLKKMSFIKIREQIGLFETNRFNFKFKISDWQIITFSAIIFLLLALRIVLKRRRR